MHVIGVVQQGDRFADQTVIVQIGGNELAHLLGCSAYERDEMAKRIPNRGYNTQDTGRFRVGDQLNASPLYESMVKLRQDAEALKAMVHKLKSVAGALENLPEVFTQVGTNKPAPAPEAQK